MPPSLCPDVERIPGKASGAWVVRGTRIPVQAVIDNADDGFSAEEIVAASIRASALSWRGV